MHSEHREWLSETSMWQDDLTLWQGDIDQALSGLKRLEDALREHRNVLQGRLDAIAAEQQAVNQHEHALAEFERGGPGDDLLRMVKPHQENADKHSLQRQTHEQLKRRQHTVMAHWSLLLKALMIRAET
jgi:hypothetical protein